VSDRLQLFLALSFALPSFQMALRQLQMWRDPLAFDDGRWVNDSALATGVEFLQLLGTVVVLALLYNIREGAIYGLVAVAAVHILLVLATTKAMGGESRRSLTRYVVLRGVALFVGGATESRDFLLLHTYIALGIFLPLMFIGTMLPVPRWGITEEVEQKIVDPKAVGVWEKKPQVALFTGATYYLLLGLFELFFLSRVDAREFMNR
jgi:hypothetical protein